MNECHFTLKTDQYRATVRVVQNEDNQLIMTNWLNAETDIKLYIDIDGRLCADVLSINESTQMIPLRYVTRIARKE